MNRAPAIVLLALLVIFSPPVNSQEKKAFTADDVPLKGKYEFKRTFVRGVVQEGIVLFTPDGEGYSITWTFESGDVIKGVGIRVGNRLSASWLADPADKKGDKILGSSLYKISLKDGKPQLEGVWFSSQTLGVNLKDNASFLK